MRQERRRNQQIRQELYVNSVHEKMKTYKRNWIQHSHRAEPESPAKTDVELQNKKKRYRQTKHKMELRFGTG